MAEENLNEDKISRGDAANRLRAIADELDGDEGLDIDTRRGRFGSLSYLSY